MNTLLGNLQSVLGSTQLQTPPIQIFNTPTLSGQKLNIVTGIDEVNRFQIGPNSEVSLFETDDDIFYVKTSDANGNIVTRRFRFYEESMDGAKYVTNDEFNKFKEEVLSGQQSIQKLIKQQSAGPRKYNSYRRNDGQSTYGDVEANSAGFKSSSGDGGNDNVQSTNPAGSSDIKKC